MASAYHTCCLKLFVCLKVPARHALPAFHTETPVSGFQWLSQGSRGTASGCSVCEGNTDVTTSLFWVRKYIIPTPRCTVAFWVWVSGLAPTPPAPSVSPSHPLLLLVVVHLSPLQSPYVYLFNHQLIIILLVIHEDTKHKHDGEVLILAGSGACHIFSIHFAKLHQGRKIFAHLRLISPGTRIT